MKLTIFWAHNHFTLRYDESVKNETWAKSNKKNTWYDSLEGTWSSMSQAEKIDLCT